jgi:hypothetical protein
MSDSDTLNLKPFLIPGLLPNCGDGLVHGPVVQFQPLGEEDVGRFSETLRYLMSLKFDIHYRQTP